MKQAACTKGMMAMTLKEARRAGSGKRGVPGEGSEACREKGARKLLRAGVRERGVPGEGTEVDRGEGERRAGGGNEACREGREMGRGEVARRAGGRERGGPGGGSQAGRWGGECAWMRGHRFTSVCPPMMDTL